MRGIHRISAGGAILATAFIAGACSFGASTAPSLPVSSLTTEASPPRAGEATSLPAPSAAFIGSDAIQFDEQPPGTELAPGIYILEYASIGGVDRFPSLPREGCDPDTVSVDARRY